MTGSSILLSHVPELRLRSRRLLAILIAVASFALATAAMIAVDVLWPEWTLLGQIVMVMLGFFIAGQFFWRRREYRAKYGDRSYRNAFLHFMLPGLPLMFAAIAHIAYLPGERVLTGWAAPLAAMIGLYFFVVGLVVWARGGLAIGADNAGMLYVYFPGEGRMVRSSIYTVIRHPMYSGMVRVGIALGLWRGTWFSLLFGLFMPVGLTLWLRLAEEPELIERFGEGYADYRRKVPAFWPRVQDWGKFAKFLLTGQ
jgi:protein-S-isoprenylcysteine O-methyltransferase Ste14